ncbi:potassium-transporting ATPase subunit KdpC [Georgenia ruanii]|uniref:potassium-transporting ATPase subunit KdpC n=1 Tax=Georgenia ruanii TaxID=348442 RepID=UPI0033882B59
MTPAPRPPRAALGPTVVAFARQSLAGLRLLLALTVLLGLVYPAVVTGLAQLAFPWQANGSLVSAHGERITAAADAVGSALVGQDLSGPGWFHPRPSVAGPGYDTLASGGSNLGPLDPALAATVARRRAAVAAEEDVPPADVPADAVTASASGLDPHISPAYARLQVPRVARVRGLPEAAVAALVSRHTQGRDLGVLGEPRVNVLELDLALATMVR